jgi:hypothetical protein
MKIKKINQIEFEEWNNLIKKTYGRKYNFQQQDDCKSRGIFNIVIPSDDHDSEMNDSIPEDINTSMMGVKFNIWLTRDTEEWNGPKKDKAFLDMFWERNFYPDIQTVANDLFKKGLIEAGEYQINIDW